MSAPVSPQDDVTCYSRRMTPLIGHSAQLDAFVTAARGDRAHHAWLLAGSRGIGKATFARLAARWVLARAADRTSPGPLDLPPDHPTARLVDAGTHPDFRQLERLWKDAGKPNQRLARNITVEQVRVMQAVLHGRPSMSDARVVVIDSADDLEAGGANALLKSLEEPPAGSTFLLVSHSPGKLLPTIRSRCRTLTFGPLADDQVRAVLEQQRTPAGQIGPLVLAADGSPGRAIAGHALDVAGMDAALERIAATGDPRLSDRSRIASSITGRAGTDRFDLLGARVPRMLARLARCSTGARRIAALDAYSQAQALAASARRLGLEPAVAGTRMMTLLAGLAPVDRSGLGDRQ